MTNTTNFLSKLSIFRDLNTEELGCVLKYIKSSEYTKDTYIIKEGDLGNNLYIIQKGDVEIRKGNTVITKLSTGEILGELSIIDAHPRSASVIALTDTKLLTFTNEAFLNLASTNLPIYTTVLLNIARVLAARLRQTDERISSL